MRTIILALLTLLPATAWAQGCYLREYTPEHMAANSGQTVRLIRATIETDALVRIYLMAEFRGDAAQYHSHELGCMQHDWDTNGVDFCNGIGSAVLVKGIGEGALLLYTEGVEMRKDNTSDPRSLGDAGEIGTVYKLVKVIDEACRR